MQNSKEIKKKSHSNNIIVAIINKSKYVDVVNDEI
jgi:hypothetical protein